MYLPLIVVIYFNFCFAVKNSIFKHEQMIEKI